MMRIIALTFLLMMSAKAHAGADIYPYQQWTDVYSHALEVSRSVGVDTVKCSEPAAGSVTETCRSTYKELYQKDSVEFRYNFGYMEYPHGDKKSKSHDAPIVEDYYAAETFIQQLVRTPCEPSEIICGFKADDEEHYSKVILGPDGNPKTIHVRVITSGVYYKDNCNRADPSEVCDVDAKGRSVQGKAREQQQLTQYAQQTYLQGLCNPQQPPGEPDVVSSIYVGHSRRCGGPSFGPANLKANGEVDYESYGPFARDGGHCQPSDERESLNAVVNKLKSCPNHPKIIGLLSCNSEMRFGDEIREAAPDVATMTVLGKGIDGEIDQGEQGARAIQSLESLLGTRCESKFNDVMNNGHVPPVQLKGFFSPDSVLSAPVIHSRGSASRFD